MGKHLFSKELKIYLSHYHKIVFENLFNNSLLNSFSYSFSQSIHLNNNFSFIAFTKQRLDLHLIHLSL